MTDTYVTLDEVRRSMPKQEPDEYLTLPQVRAMQEKSFKDFILKRETSDLSSNLRRGVKDVIDTGAEGLAWAWDKLTGTDPDKGEFARVRGMNAAGKAQWQADNEGAILPHIQRMTGNVLSTLPATAVAGSGVAAAGLPRLGAAISSGGMTTGGGLGRVADLATRTAGGAINGRISAGLVDPEAADAGTVIGAVLPGGLQAVNATLGGLGRAYNRLTTPADQKLAAQIADIAGLDPRDPAAIQEVLGLLRRQGPEIIPGATVPELLQNPGLSQLQRTLQAVKPGAFQERAAQREAARLGVLERIAPVGNRREVADEVGTAISDYAIPARQAETAQVSRLFDAVDPFEDVRVNLPIDEMKAARDKFLGPGVFGQGKDANLAIKTAEEIGMQDVQGIKALANPASRQPQTLLQAIRRVGGIDPRRAGGMDGEISDFTRKQSGTTGLVTKKGRPLDLLAQDMHERGFIQSEDPAELVDAIRRSLKGDKIYAADVTEDSFRARLEQSMGDAPEGGQIPKPVKWREVQNLRSALNDKWDEAQRFMRTREAAALRKMIDEVDDHIGQVIAGKGSPAEVFPADIVQNWKEALAAHGEKKMRFDTGPQAAMFRRGGDNLPAAQGGEIPRRFFHGNASQVQDAQAFRRLVQDDPKMMGELRRFAVSDAAAQKNQTGLSAAKFNDWLDARAGATGELFTQQQRTWLKAIADDLRRAATTESLGRSTGSDTMQKAASMLQLGMLDNPATKFIGGKVPGGSGILEMLRDGARTSRADRLSQMLLDPEQTAGLLEQFVTRQQPVPPGVLSQFLNGPLIYRTAPIVSTANY